MSRKSTLSLPSFFLFFLLVGSVFATTATLKPSTALHKAYYRVGTNLAPPPPSNPSWVETSPTEFTTVANGDYDDVQIDDITNRTARASGTCTHVADYCAAMEEYTFNLTGYSSITNIEFMWDGFGAMTGDNQIEIAAYAKTAAAVWTFAGTIPATDGVGWEIDFNLDGTAGKEIYVDGSNLFKCGAQSISGKLGTNAAASLACDAIQIIVTYTAGGGTYSYTLVANQQSFESRSATKTLQTPVSSVSRTSTSKTMTKAASFPISQLSRAFSSVGMSWGYSFLLNIVPHTFTSNTVVKALSFQESSSTSNFARLLANWALSFKPTSLTQTFMDILLGFGKAFNLNAVSNTFSSALLTKDVLFTLAEPQRTITSILSFWSLIFEHSSLAHTFANIAFAAGKIFNLDTVSSTFSSILFKKNVLFDLPMVQRTVTSILSYWSLAFEQTSLSKTIVNVAYSVEAFFHLNAIAHAISGTFSSLLFSKEVLFNLPETQRTIASIIPNWNLVFDLESLGRTFSDILYNLGRTFDLTSISNTLVSIFFSKDMQFALSEMQRTIVVNPFEVAPNTPMSVVVWLVVGLGSGLALGMVILARRRRKEVDGDTM